MDFGVATLTRGECATREGYIAVAEAAERLGYAFIGLGTNQESLRQGQEAFASGKRIRHKLR